MPIDASGVNRLSEDFLLLKGVLPLGLACFGLLGSVVHAVLLYVI